jgi:predicted kinase
MPTLYLMLGYPGAGKSTTAEVIAELTGAVHVWADHERQRMFVNPTHKPDENRKLYSHLNTVVDQLLADGKSVIFDTNFNFYKDREHLRRIAAKQGAKTLLIWVQTDKALARERATHSKHAVRNTYLKPMPSEHFDRIARNMQPPRADETVIIIDGTDVTKDRVASLLSHGQ